MSNKQFPLIIEEHPNNYNGYEFITLVNYIDKRYLCIIDNVTKKHIVSYVLDSCAVNNVCEKEVIDIAYEWYTDESKNYPISIEFSRLGISEDMSSILRLFSIDYVTRVIGPLPKYDMTGPIKVRKRKRKPIPANMEYTVKRIKK